MAIPDDAFWVSKHRAKLRLRDTPLCDSFVFGSCAGVASVASTTVNWWATTDRQTRGLGAGADPAAPGAFLGEFSDASCEATVSGRQTGFHFSTPSKLDASGFFAEFGTQSNGAFL